MHYIDEARSSAVFISTLCGWGGLRPVAGQTRGVGDVTALDGTPEATCDECVTTADYEGLRLHRTAACPQ